MAAAAPMELSDSSEMNKRHGLLAVNKASGKIQKGGKYRPVAQPRAAPTVYMTEADNFRSLVQQLTGTSPSDPAPPNKPAGNTRLQKCAPPPLRPTFSYPKLVQPSPNGLQLSSPNNGQRFNSMTSFNSFGSSLSPLTQRINPFPMLSPHSFSPLPALSPSDQIWANPLESPSSAALRQLAQTMAANENQNNLQAGLQPPQPQQQQQQVQQGGDILRMDNVSGGGGPSILGSFPPLSPSNFSLSPRFPSQYSNLPSPVGLGMASGFGISNIYNMGTLNSPTAGLPMDFAFPEPDFVSTGLS